MKNLEKSAFALNDFAKDLDGEFNGRSIAHKKFGKGIIESFGASAGVIVRVDFGEDGVRNLSWDACMKNNLFESDSVVDSMRPIYDSYDAILKEIEADRRIEIQKQKESKEKETRDRKEKEKYDAYVRNQIIRVNDCLKNSRDDIHSDSDDWVSGNIKCITAQVPDFLDKWFRKVFPNASYTVIDSHRRTSGGYKMKWGLSLSAVVKRPETAPSWIRPKIKGNKITDVETLFNIAINNNVKIGK